MGTTSKICSVIFRAGELCSAAIVAGIIGRYLRFLTVTDTHAGSRIIYAEVIAGISLLFSIVLFLPLKYTFYCFPVDFILFILWMVAFGLLCNLTGTHGCDSYWFWNSWGYYWGRYWHTAPGIVVTQSLVGRAGCGQWRATLAFSFIGGLVWCVSGFLGIYKCVIYFDERRSPNSEMGTVSAATRIRRWRRKSDPGTGGISTKDESTNLHPGENN